jgi:hypothetical protein
MGSESFRIRRLVFGKEEEEEEEEVGGVSE